MPGARSPVHPYIPNSVPEIKEAMLREVGAADVDELYGAIPERLRLRRPLTLEPALRSEVELRRHLEAMLARNGSCRETLSLPGRRLLAALRARRSSTRSSTAASS